MAGARGRRRQGSAVGEGGLEEQQYRRREVRARGGKGRRRVVGSRELRSLSGRGRREGERKMEEEDGKAWRGVAREGGRGMGRRVVGRALNCRRKL